MTHPSPTQLPSRLLAGVAAHTIRPALARLSPESIAGRIAIRTIVGAPSLLGADSRYETYCVRARSPRGEWVRPQRHGARRVVLFLHGGGYVAGSARAYRRSMGLLAATSRCAVFGLDYPRAPEHRRPAALDGAVDAYRMLLARHPEVVLLGDSAGAHLALELVTALYELGLPLPAKVALFSPLLRPANPQARERDAQHRDPVVSPAFADRCIVAVLGPDHATATEASTDAIAGLAKVPSDRLPCFGTWVGSTECYVDDVAALHRQLTGSAGPHHHEVVAEQLHSFLALATLIEPAAAAVARAGHFLGEPMLPPGARG